MARQARHALPYWVLGERRRQRRRHLLQRIVAEVTLGGEIRQAICQSELMITRRQRPDVEGELPGLPRTCIVGQRAQPMQCLHDGLFLLTPGNLRVLGGQR